MQHPTHPDDERLSALAGGDPDVASDAVLRAHIDSCERCAETVRELGSLRAALSELPDLVPSRPLQLLPPVPVAKAASAGGWLRRMAGPATTAGLVLVVVGAIGSSGIMAGLGASAGEIFQNVGENLETGEGGGSVTGQPPAGAASSPPRSAYGQDSGSEAQGSTAQERSTTPQPQAEAPTDQGVGGGLFAPSDPRLLWLVVLGLGVGLLLAGIFLRFARQPRAG